MPLQGGLSFEGFSLWLSNQIDTEEHINANWTAKDIDEGLSWARAGWGALGGDWNLSLSRSYPLTLGSGMRRGGSKAER